MKKIFVSWILMAIFTALLAFFGGSPSSGLAGGSYHSSLRRYPYLTDVVGPYATINWGTDRSEFAGAVRWGRVGYESCTSHYVSDFHYSGRCACCGSLSNNQLWNIHCFTGRSDLGGQNDKFYTVFCERDHGFDSKRKVARLLHDKCDSERTGCISRRQQLDRIG